MDIASTATMLEGIASLLTMLFMGGGALVAYGKWTSRLETNEENQKQFAQAITRSLDKLSDSLNKSIDKHDERIDNHEVRISVLEAEKRHGDGSGSSNQ